MVQKQKKKTGASLPRLVFISLSICYVLSFGISCYVSSVEYITNVETLGVSFATHSRRASETEHDSQHKRILQEHVTLSDSNLTADHRQDTKTSKEHITVSVPNLRADDSAQGKRILPEQITISDPSLSNDLQLNIIPQKHVTGSVQDITDDDAQHKKILQEHVTVSVPNLAQAKLWYSSALPLVEVPRRIRTAVKGAWYKFVDVPTLFVHLLEVKPKVGAGESGDGSTADVTGQHVGLDLGIAIGNIRNELYDKGIAATLAAVSSTIENKASGLREEQQAIFLTGPGQMTWEFTNLFPYKRQMKLVPSKVALPANRIGIHLNRSTSSSTARVEHNKEGSIHKAPTNHFKYSISSGNPLATAAGYVCLQAGGSAADATIAAAAVMSVVEPYNGGLGGDFVAMIHDPANKGSYEVLNGSGRAPKNAISLPENMKSVPKTGISSILSVPGAPSAWCRLHARYGKMPWKLILQPAIMMASEGFLLTERTAQVWEAAALKVMDYDMSEEAKEEFLRMFAPPSGDHGERMSPRAGERYYNPTLAYTLQRFANGGCEWFYNEAVYDILDHVEKRGGLLKKSAQKEDMQIDALDYASWEEPLSTNYTRGKDTYEIFAPDGNSQAGSALLILNMMQRKNRTSSAESRQHLLHRHINAKRIVYRDTFRKAPYDQALINDKGYTERSVEEIQRAFRRSVSVDINLEESSSDTEGLVVRDSNGLVLSVLQSMSLPFGSGVVVPSLGIALHGRGYGFDTGNGSEFSYLSENRPWTTLSPFMVKKNGKFWMAASVKGGDRQPYAFTQIFLNMVELGYSPMEAVSSPRFRDQSHHNNSFVVEFDIPPYLPEDESSLDGDDDELYEYLNSNGFECEKFIPDEIEDSGFGVAQLLLDETEYPHGDPIGYSRAVRLVSVSDLARKPGLALTGEQPSLAAEKLHFPKLVKNLISFRDLDHIAQPFRHFIEYHLRPLTENELCTLAEEGLDDLPEYERMLQKGRNQKRLTIARNAAAEENKDDQFMSLRHFSQLARVIGNNAYLVRKSKLYVRDIDELHLPNEFDAFFLQPGDYPTVAMKNYIFPVGNLPLIGADSYLDELREHNPEIHRILHPLVPENMPTLYDSREPWMKAGVLFQIPETERALHGDESTSIEQNLTKLTQNSETNMSLHSVPMPSTLDYQDLAENNNLDMLNFPVVLKAEGQFAGEGISIARNLTEFIRDARNRYNQSQDFVVQEALRGKDEFTIHFIGHYGHLLAVECFESTFNGSEQDLHIKGKNDKPTNKGRGFKGCAKEMDAIRIADKILRGTLYNGFGCVQYKRNPESGRIGIIEMNPRTCGGLFSIRKVKNYAPKVIRMIRKWLDANNEP